ncbi:unnamed protein product [Lampetra fluviatilis]
MSVVSSTKSAALWTSCCEQQAALSSLMKQKQDDRILAETPSHCGFCRTRAVSGALRGAWSPDPVLHGAIGTLETIAAQ